MFCKDDIIKLDLMSQKGVYLFEYMDFWEKFGEALLSKKGVLQ